MKKHLLIFLKTGGVVKIEELPDDFRFDVMCMSVRANGYFNNGHIDIAYGNINAMAYTADQKEFSWGPIDGSTLQ
jgi:hypothetical protein